MTAPRCGPRALLKNEFTPPCGDVARRAGLDYARLLTTTQHVAAIYKHKVTTCYDQSPRDGTGSASAESEITHSCRWQIAAGVWRVQQVVNLVLLRISGTADIWG